MCVQRIHLKIKFETGKEPERIRHYIGTSTVLIEKSLLWCSQKWIEWNSSGMIKLTFKMLFQIKTGVFWSTQRKTIRAFKQNLNSLIFWIIKFVTLSFFLPWLTLLTWCATENCSWPLLSPLSWIRHTLSCPLDTICPPPVWEKTWLTRLPPAIA